MFIKSGGTLDKSLYRSARNRYFRSTETIVSRVKTLIDARSPASPRAQDANQIERRVMGREAIHWRYDNLEFNTDE